MRVSARRLLTVATATAAAGLASATTALASADLTWTGTGNTDRWSNALNWSTPAVAPLVFNSVNFPYLPACAGQTTGTCYRGQDDLGPATANELTIDASQPYWIVPSSSGDTLTLDGNGAIPNVGVVAAPTEGTVNFPALDVPIVLGSDQTWDIQGAGNQSLPGGLQTQVVSGNHTLALNFSNNGSLEVTTLQTGAVTVSGDGWLGTPAGSSTNATFPSAGVTLQDGSSLEVAGFDTVSGPLSANGSTIGNSIDVGGGYQPDGTLSVNGGVSFNSRTTLNLSIDRAGTTVGTDYSQLTANGSIDFGGATLALPQGASWSSCSSLGHLSPGDTYTPVLATGSLTGDLSYVDINGVEQTLTPGSTGSGLIPIACHSGTPVPASISYGANAITVTILSGIAPVEQFEPIILGTPDVGSGLSASPGIWSGAPTSYAYNWYSCDPANSTCATNVASGTATYTPTAADLGHVIYVCVTAQNAYGNASACSPPTAIVSVAAATGTTQSPVPPTSPPSSPPTNPPTNPSSSTPAADPATPGTGSSTPGPTTAAAAPSAAAIRTALSSLRPPGAPTATRALIRTGSFPTSFAAPGAGALGITWTSAVTTGQGRHRARRRVTVALGSGHLNAAGRLRVAVRLTRAGKGLLHKQPRGLAITATEAFQPVGGARTSVIKHFRL